MQFKLWSKVGKHRLYRIDTDIKDNPYIDITKARPMVGGGDHDGRQALTQVIKDCALSQCSTVDEVIMALELGGHEVVQNGTKKPTPKKKEPFPLFHAVDVRPAEEIIKQINDCEVHKAPFKKSTLRSAKLYIDSREPECVLDAFKHSPLDVERAGLPIGDFKVTDTTTGDTLIFERKTISDLYSSTISTHLHSQAERLYSWQHTLDGVRGRVVWIIEAEQGGSRVLYNALPLSKQVDGLINYFVGVLGQFVVQSYNVKHTAYLIHKIAQGFLEQQLPYPVKSDNGARIDALKRDRAIESTVSEPSKAHGVSIPGRDTLQRALMTIPGVNTAIADALAASNLPLTEILMLTEDKLIEFKGVGKKTAAIIAQEFSALTTR